MSSLTEEFVTLDRDNHARMKGAIQSALSADFKVDESPRHDSNAGFTRKPLEFFVREKIDPASFIKVKPDPAPTPGVSEAVATASLSPEEGSMVAEAELVDVPSHENELDDLAQLLSDDTAPSDETESQLDTVKPFAAPEEPVDSQQSEHYDEGFAAGRAAALSELEEQRLEHLEVLKSISEKLLTDSVFNFDNISQKVLDTVNELSSERCGLAIDKNPEGFLKRIASQIEKVRNLSEERSVFFNKEDLEALKSFDEFESYFSKAHIRSDPTLKRGDVVVKVGGVELRDAPFHDYGQDLQDE